MPALCATRGGEAKTLPQAKEHGPQLWEKRGQAAQPIMLSREIVPQAGRRGPMLVFSETQTLTAQAGGIRTPPQTRADPRRKDWGKVWGAPPPASPPPSRTRSPGAGGQRGG